MEIIVGLMLVEAIVWIVGGIRCALDRPAPRTRPADPPSEAAVDRARELQVEGLSVRQIVSTLNDERYRDSCGAEFSERSVERVLNARPAWWHASLKSRRR